VANPSSVPSTGCPFRSNPTVIGSKTNVAIIAIAMIKNSGKNSPNFILFTLFLHGGSIVYRHAEIGKCLLAFIIELL